MSNALAMGQHWFSIKTSYLAMYVLLEKLILFLHESIIDPRVIKSSFQVSFPYRLRRLRTSLVQASCIRMLEHNYVSCYPHKLFEAWESSHRIDFGEGTDPLNNSDCNHLWLHVEGMAGGSSKMRQKHFGRQVIMFLSGLQLINQLILNKVLPSPHVQWTLVLGCSPLVWVTM